MNLKQSFSTMTIQENLIRQTIIEHYEHPKNKVTNSFIKKNKGYLKGHSDSPSCIDNIDVYAKIKNDKILDVKFSGIGCAICTSSTDLMSIELTNKTIKQARTIINNYLAMIKNDKYNEKSVKKLIFFKNVNKQPNRLKCATTGILAISKAISNYEKTKK